MKGKGRLWVTPKLIVLARSQAEECVLTHCKTVAGSTGPHNSKSRLSEWTGALVAELVKPEVED